MCLMVVEQPAAGQKFHQKCDLVVSSSLLQVEQCQEFHQICDLAVSWSSLRRVGRDGGSKEMVHPYETNKHLTIEFRDVMWLLQALCCKWRSLRRVDRDDGSEGGASV